MNYARVVVGLVACALFSSSVFAYRGGAAGALSADKIKKLNTQLYVEKKSSPAKQQTN